MIPSFFQPPSVHPPGSKLLGGVSEVSRYNSPLSSATQTLANFAIVASELPSVASTLPPPTLPCTPAASRTPRPFTGKRAPAAQAKAVAILSKPASSTSTVAAAAEPAVDLSALKISEPRAVKSRRLSSSVKNNEGVARLSKPDAPAAVVAKAATTATPAPRETNKATAKNKTAQAAALAAPMWYPGPSRFLICVQTLKRKSLCPCNNCKGKGLCHHKLQKHRYAHVCGVFVFVCAGVCVCVRVHMCGSVYACVPA